MLNDLLNQQTVQITDRSDLSWQDAIKLAAEPLVTNGSITEQYVTSMIDVVDNQGPYINIGDHIALAHTRPENGSNRISLALLKTSHTVDLVNHDHPITLWFVLSAVDNESHLEVIKQLMSLLTDEKKVEALMNSSSVDAILNAISQTVS
ncbi:MAG TPA: PTS mannitol transporter subunit IIA [Lactobacillus sp.]|nr:PTS mannitol transporter subunit IIA [Lactobacillus sp.]